MAKFYITNAIPYVNAKPHVGHSLEFVQSDTIARWHKILGDDVLLLCGGDENALKNVQAAEKAGVPVQDFVDTNTQLFADLANALNVHFDVFQKGSSPMHHASSQKLWELCNANGDIYKKEYTGLYCVGCELFYEKDELNENGECFEHPGKPLEEVTEENYFFRLSKYQKAIEAFIATDALQITPAHRKKEILTFVRTGLEDISISRSNERAKNWGVPVPNDDTQRMYVWFDALNIYQSGVGFGSAEQNSVEMYKKWWPADVHVIGKGIIRFHAVYWPAFLLSAHLPLPKSLFVHGYFTVNGQKMSKTLGNVIDPLSLIPTYGSDGLRYYFLHEIPPTSDGDFSLARLKEVYNADLANGLGNVVARVAKLCETSHFTQLIAANKTSEHLLSLEGYGNALNEYRFHDALSFIWKKISALDKFINEEKPWELVQTDLVKLREILSHAVDQIQEIAILLEPFLPTTAQKIEDQFSKPEITSAPSLFPRL